MSFDWSLRAQRRPDSYFDQLMTAREALGLAFSVLDVAQREATTNVQSYKRLLPDRAEKTGLVARFDMLDTETNGAMRTYLDLLDRHDPISEIPEMYWPAATRTLQDHEGVMRDLAAKLESLQNDYAVEFHRIGGAIQDIHQQVAAAARSVKRAERARAAMAESGYELRVVDVPLARARLALRAITENKVELTTANVEQASSHICSLAEEAAELAGELPQRIAKLAARRSSLTTRLAAITNMATQLPEEMSVLRREFSVANFADLQEQEQALPSMMAAAKTRLDRLGLSIDQRSWEAALSDVTAATEALRRVESVVGAPRERIEVLRRAKSNPDAALSRLRFVVKDARYLLMNRGSTTAPQPWGDRIDACAREVDALATALTRGHPDYWGVLQCAEELQRRVDAITHDFRISHRNA